MTILEGIRLYCESAGLSDEETADACLRVARGSLMRVLEARGGRGVELADRIDHIDAAVKD